MPKRKGKTALQDAFDAIAGFRDLVDETFVKLTGKPISAWLREYESRPRELPGEKQPAPSQPSMALADAYAVLGLTPNAPPEQVKKHYRNLARLFHSDMGAMNDEAMKLLNRAYDRIKREKGEN
ncbi:hypothetical protein ES703_57825 [subsurface metagenome]